MYKGESKINIKTLMISLRCREILICILLNKYCAVKETSVCLLCVWKWFNTVLDFYYKISWKNETL